MYLFFLNSDTVTLSAFSAFFYPFLFRYALHAACLTSLVVTFPSSFAASSMTILAAPQSASLSAALACSPPRLP